MKDIMGRNINYLRLSITDSCNLRCLYCMPEEGVQYEEEKNLISMDEAFYIVKIFAELGIKKVRITGGEPLVRKGVCDLIKNIKSLNEIEEINITTNGVLLEKYLDELYINGITGLNISLDTLNEDRYKKITRGGNLNKVVDAIKRAKKYDLKVKLNSLIIQDFNEDEVNSLVEFAIENKLMLRFIELMPIGYGKTLKGFKNEEIKNIVEKKFKLSEFSDEPLGINGPAKYFKLDNSDIPLGFISPISGCFCDTCNRVRVTSDGKLKECLYYKGNLNLKDEIRNKTSEEEIKDKIIKAVFLKKKQHKFFEKDNDIEESEKKNMSMIGG